MRNEAGALENAPASFLASNRVLEAINLFETAHHRLFGFLSGLRPEQWNGYIRAWVTGSTWHHFEARAKQIRSWRSSR
jgi:hypothetical protein